MYYSSHTRIAPTRALTTGALCAATLAFAGTALFLGFNAEPSTDPGGGGTAPPVSAGNVADTSSRPAATGGATTGDARLAVAAAGLEAAAVEGVAPPVHERSTTAAPAGASARLRREIAALDPDARERALARLALRPELAADPSLHVTAGGAFLHACGSLCAPNAPAPSATGGASLPATGDAGTTGGTGDDAPAAAPPVLHSRPGAPNVLVLVFTGGTITNTAWNSAEGSGRDVAVPAYAAKPFSLDADGATFNAAERALVTEVWERVAEDFAPFDVDVTTEQPAAGSAGTAAGRTARVLITSATDANGVPMPFCTSGGASYLGFFGTPNLEFYGPSLVYYDKTGGAACNIADAAAHELGHTFGLSHDGSAAGAYYHTHGAGAVSWGPLMGTPYGANLTQWSRGEYATANNTEDDIALIAGKLGYRAETAALAPENARPLTPRDTGGGDGSGGTTGGARTLGAEGVLLRGGDAHHYAINLGELTVLSLRAAPKRIAGATGNAGSTLGGNADLRLEILDAAGNVIHAADPDDDTAAALTSIVLGAGAHIVRITSTGRGAPDGDGYSAYGSIGQYTLETDLPAPQETTTGGDTTGGGSDEEENGDTADDDAGADVDDVAEDTGGDAEEDASGGDGGGGDNDASAARGSTRLPPTPNDSTTTSTTTTSTTTSTTGGDGASSPQTPDAPETPDTGGDTLSTTAEVPGVGEVEADIPAASRPFARGELERAFAQIRGEPEPLFEVREGAALTLTVPVTGNTAALRFTWQEAGADGVWRAIAGAANSPSCTVTARAGARWRVLVEGASAVPIAREAPAGSVLGAPLLLVEPDDATLAGGAATLGVVATGTGALCYAWRFSENGQTGSFAPLNRETGPVVRVERAGFYYCDIGDRSGLTTTSRVARVAE
ncbi:MAG: hypothetical protein LBR07_01250 [Puniceicoccales bacterium]|jgi:hypothetical protein|nr:hypothetical protein [Puniceicoccales bacterium]